MDAMWRGAADAYKTGRRKTVEKEMQGEQQEEIQSRREREAQERMEKRNMERTLRKVIVILKEDREGQVLRLSEMLAQEGIVCELLKADAEYRAVCELLTGASPLSTVIITDSRTLAGQLSERRFVCIGLEEKDSFFEGASLVTDSLEELDADTLEECLLHMTGRPVTAARTPQLILREMTAEDAPRLYEISTQAGMEKALAGGLEQNFFRRETLLPYIDCAYRFFGFGLWSVLTTDGTLIGCCGFSHWEDKIELQYMLDEAYRGKGYGTQMCRAALSYAALRTEWERIYVRIAPDNEPSLRLAERLGFQITEKQAEAQCAENQPELQNTAAQSGNCLQRDYIVLEYNLATGKLHGMQ